jgi:hypothetical protein
MRKIFFSFLSMYSDYSGMEGLPGSLSRGPDIKYFCAPKIHNDDFLSFFLLYILWYWDAV